MATVPPPCTDAFDMHPLELIPWFRGRPPGAARDLLYTAIWNTLLAVAFTILGAVWVSKVPILTFFGWNLVFAHCIGYTIHVLFAITGSFPGRPIRRSGLGRAVYYAAIPVVGVIVGYVLGATLLGWLQFRTTILTPRGLATLVALSLLLSAILAAILLPRERAARAEADAAREQARAAAAEREAAFAQLKALEAQVEPHFLYNTLAHVVSLLDEDPRNARAMLERLIALLRETARTGSLPATLGGQTDLVRSWLEILAMRMGRRLVWSIDIPDELRRVEVPPALLQPLVENAIKHGLEPAIDGGGIDVAARRDGDALVITVADSGVGFGGGSAPLGGSTGLGLSGLRQRLAALYGDAASLKLTEREPRGVRATLRVPLSAQA